MYFTYNDKGKSFDQREVTNVEVERFNYFRKIQNVKTFVIPIFRYRASLICVQKDTVIEVNKLLFKFIWKGRERQRQTLISYM